MPKLSELVAGDSADESSGSASLSDLLAKSRAQFAGPDQTMDQAVKSDAGGLASLDFTNPSNMGNVAHTVLPMALQALLTGAGGALGGAVGPTMARAGQVFGSSVGSLLGYLYQNGAEPMAQGQPPTATTEGAFGAGLTGGLLEGGTQLAGGLGRGIAGKGAALREGEAAAQDALATRADLAAKATAQADAAATTAQNKVQSAQDAVNTQVLKHSEDAFQGVKEAEVERMVKEGLGPQAVVQQPVTIESLTSDVAPAQKAAIGAMQGVFKGISAKYEKAVEPYGDLPIPNSTLRATVNTIRDDLKEYGDAISPGLSKLLNVASGRAAEDVPASMSIGRQPVKYGSYATTGAERTRLANILAEKASEAGQSAAPPTVNQMMGLRSQFINVIRTAKNGTDRRVAASAVGAIQNDIGQVMPADMQPVMQNLADEWHQAKSTFSDAFRNRLWRASSPDQVAEAIYNGAKTGKQMGHRAELLVNQVTKESPDQLPVLRQSFASMLANSPNVVADVQKMPPSLFKSMFPGTGFDDPKNWVQALQGQIVFKQIAGSPELLAKYQSIFQQGMISLGTRAKQDALAKAQSMLSDVPNSQQMIANALKETPSPGQAFEQGAMAGMKQPMLGKGMNNYVEHKAMYHAAMAMAGVGAFTSHSYLALPLAYLGSSKAVGALLSNPTIGRMYYNALTSKTAEQGMFWMGRTVAAGLTQAANQSE